jgi:hypothetical protein
VQPQEPRPGKLVDETVMAQRRALRAELAEETLQERAAAAERAVVSMEERLRAVESALAEARAERDALAGELLAREREVRHAVQREFAERMVRGELEAELAAARRAADAEIAELREHVDVLAEEAERLEEAAEQARREAAVAKRRLAGERDAAAAAVAESELVRAQVVRRVEAVQQTVSDLRDELEDRVIAERGRAALALARERELWEAAVETERARADAERAARHRVEAELGARVAAQAESMAARPARPTGAQPTPPPATAAAPHTASPPYPELGHIHAVDLRGPTRREAGDADPTVAVAETVIADLARAADRLRAQVEARADGRDAAPAVDPAARRRRRWWPFPWRRSLPAARVGD